MLPWLGSPRLQSLQPAVVNTHTYYDSQSYSLVCSWHIETGREALAVALWLLFVRSFIPIYCLYSSTALSTPCCGCCFHQAKVNECLYYKNLSPFYLVHLYNGHWNDN